MQAIANALHLIVVSTQHNFVFSITLVGILWAIQIVNTVFGNGLNRLGIVPRTAVGLRGIVFSPLLHGDFNHLFFNSIPLFMLSNLVLLNGRVMFYAVTLFVVVVGGLAIWLFGKRGVHIGASSLIMGYFGYLLAGAYFKFDATAIILALIALYYFGGLLLSLFPGEKHVSWEGHVFGAAAGVLAAYYSHWVLKIFALVLSVFI
jgi:membrane associated rhomboid family serine protease